MFFFDKATGKLADRAKILGEPNGRKRSRWNMPDKDIELEAHYVELADTISFNFPATDETNPNTLKSCKYSDGEVRLLDTTTTNKFKTFKCWEYQNITYEEKDAPWYEIVDGILPNDYQEDYMRIQAVFETEQLQISFNFETEKGQSLDFDDFINTLKIYSNFAIVDGIKGPIGTKHDGAIITKDSIVLVDSVYGWADLFFTLKTGYSFSYVKLNGVKNKQIDASFIDPLYITIKENYLPSDSVITFVVSTN